VIRDPLIGVNGSGSFGFVGSDGFAGSVVHVPGFVGGVVVVLGGGHLRKWMLKLAG